VTTTSVRRQQIVSSLRDKEYRDAFVAAQIDTGLPFQIRNSREARGWSQRELAERAGMTQEAVSRLESLSYGRFSLSTLKRLASAFDVALEVKFVPFSQLADRAANVLPQDLAVPDFEHDRRLLTQAANSKSSEAVTLATIDVLVNPMPQTIEAMPSAADRNNRLNEPRPSIGTLSGTAQMTVVSERAA
jgi:transcriptional regulator with XRE-family HTH domain